MATRNPKVKPVKKRPSNPATKSKESTSSKAWTDTDDTEVTKETKAEDEKESMENIKGSVISVREAEDSNKTDTINEEPDVEPSTAPSENGAIDPPMTTDTEVPNGTESDSIGSLESATRRRIKRNQIAPTDAEESSRQSPDSEARKDAWSELDADEESNAASSRPGSAPVFRQAGRPQSAKKRPYTAAASRARDARPIERPIHSSTISGYEVSAPGTTDSARPTSSQSRAMSQPGEEPLAITNGEIEPWSPTVAAERERASLSSRSSEMLAPPMLSGEQNAYIPYIFARECIQKVTDDMKRMKASHVKVVDQIQEHYKHIEDDVQGKFNTFVFSLRSEYQGKVKTFRHVIEVHREDARCNQNFWEWTCKSLQVKNKNLMQEKRKLLIKNRDEINHLECEKEKAVKDLTSMLDERHAKYTKLLAEFKNEKNKTQELEEKLRILEEKDLKNMQELDSNRASYGREIEEAKQQFELLQKEKVEKDESYEREKKEREEAWEEERKKLNEQNEQYSQEIGKLKEDIEKLKQELAVAATAAVTVTTATMVTSAKTEAQSKEETQEEVKEESEGDVEGVKKAEVVTVAQTVSMLDNKEREKLTAEIARLKEELEQSNEEAAKSKEEGEREYKEKILKLEEELSLLGKEKARYEQQATDSKQELRESRQQCTALHSQLQTLLATAVSKKDDAETDEQLKSAEEQKQKLLEEQARMKEEMEKLKEKFKSEQEGEEPEEDKSDEISTMMAKLKEEEEKLKEAENKIAVMNMLKEGAVPETVAVAAGVSVSSEKLDELENRISQLEAEKDGLEVEVERLTKERDSLNEKSSDQEEKITELQQKITELKEDIEEEKKDNEKLRNELDEAANMVAPIGTITPVLAVEGQDVEGIQQKLTELQEELENATADLEKEKEENSNRSNELGSLKLKLRELEEGSSGRVDELEALLKTTRESLEAELNENKQSLVEAKSRVKELEEKLMANVPVDTAQEMKAYQEKVSELQSEKEKASKECTKFKAEVTSLKAKVDSLNNSVTQLKKSEAELQDSNKKMRFEKDKEVKEIKEKLEGKSKKQVEENNKKIQALQKRIKELESAGAAPRSEAKTEAAPARRKDSRIEEKLAKDKEKLESQVEALKKASKEDHAKIKALEKEVKEAAQKAKAAGPSAEDRAAAKKQEKQIKDLTKNLEMEKKKLDKIKDTLAKTEEELKDLKKEHDALIAESKKDKATLANLEVAAAEGLEAQNKVQELTKEVKELREENKTLADNYNSERILRKKYYNMVEDMKGKIRVYCRARPLSKSELERGNFSVVKSPDEYTVIIDTQRGPKDFQFDQVFVPEHGQERVFEDTNNLIQSAVDGYNVCIFAYGQTGSGKTFTMIGDKEGNFPGIAPRAFNAIFSLLEENKKKFSFKVYCYMLELYNDRLIDLLAPTGKEPAKLDIKKDKKGLVFVNGSVMLEADTAEGLTVIFNQGSENRHVASTKMNAESSRSHLILGIVIESTNLTSGAVMKGKLSLVDLAGSERAAKTGASAEQLKEAQSINKSLSALGDVISALSSEQSFIPYRNNKLTMLMQDSLGGNAKTLMFVNISPADYNIDETVTSLTYASRVKLITNDASKNADNKEIARLKGIIAKLKKGEAVEVEDE